jgi:hypothetical protein
VDSEIRDFLAKARQLDKEAHEKIHELNRNVAHFAMGHQLEDLKEKYCVNPRIPEYLDEVQEDISATCAIFSAGPGNAHPREGMDKGSFVERCKVNLIVDNAGIKAPVVDERTPPTTIWGASNARRGSARSSPTL